ncbi:MAG: substrate-binding domain-containing protein [Proteobacteria bacterium]|nr:substrate-binding domain-containing protein [Pseudomonadota bacterium]
MIKNLIYIICLSHFLLSNNVIAKDILRMAVTTSTENSGLLSVLLPPFEDEHQIKMHILSVGSGKALRLGQNGDVDLVLVHAPDAEKRFINAGYGVGRTAVMHNDFILLGPGSDPAGVKSATSLADALGLIKMSQSTFISRGDDSGTHKKEQKLWETAGIKLDRKWYLSIGQGMGAALTMAYEKQAYILSDRGTYLAYLGKMNLDIVYEKDEILKNPYHIILVNPKIHPHIKTELAQKFIDYITAEEGQKIILDFRINNEPLFYPDVIN